ncbi:hypothetical protein HOR87_gp03 [Marinomonas phage CB5A]|uniref:Uncharacterized protein n=1 Tax=Marinomonas phage CB5A TaxID=2022859 RepID=A0A222G2Y1_9CAUD|nr:hypothetical protein HOR87_gp03 [Marinomonas phage CB5A]ASP46288.1 hypothetical protein [Marinomonas phage CB5A]
MTDKTALQSAIERVHKASSYEELRKLEALFKRLHRSGGITLEERMSLDILIQYSYHVIATCIMIREG